MNHRPQQKLPNAGKTDLRRRGSIFVDLGILFVLFIAPLFLGGRHPLGRLIFVSSVFLLATFWSLENWRARETSMTLSRVFLIPLFGIAICVLQLIQLPPKILQLASPRLNEFFPGFANPQTESTWTTISLSPVDSRESLCVYLAYVLLFFVIVQRMRTKNDVHRLLSWLAYATVALAAIGLIQYLRPNGRFLWIYAHPTRETFAATMGPFVNANHFAHMMAIGLGPVMWLAIQHTNPRKQPKHRRPNVPKYLSVAGVCLTLLAGMLSYSRAGIGLLTLVSISLGCIVIRRSGRKQIHLISLGIPILLCCVALSLHGTQSIVGELTSLSDLTRADFGERKILWTAVCRGIENFTRMGTGAGSHSEVYRTFMDRPLDRNFTHAENGYLQVLLETGIVGFATLVGGILLAIGWATQCIKRYKGDDRLLVIAIAIAIAVSLLHSLCDFVWYIPACATWLIVLLAILFRLHQWSDEGQSTSDSVVRPHDGLFAVVIVLTGAFCFNILLPSANSSGDWEDYLSVSIASNLQHRRIPKTGRQRDVKNASLDSPSTICSMRASLENVVRLHPAHARAHSRLASLYLQAFDLAQQDSEDPMGVTQIRDAAYASEFKSSQELFSWLSVALGDNLALLTKAYHHAQASIRNCPLQGKAYLYLSELAFLQSPNPGLPGAYIRQAERVRPKDGAVLFAAGQTAALEGRIDEAFEHWKSAFEFGGIYQQKVIDIFAAQLNARPFIERFSPDIDGLQRLYTRYTELGRVDQNSVVSEELVRLIDAHVRNESVSHADLVRLGLRLREVRQYSAASDIYQLAHVRAPYNFQTRWRLAKSLVDAERYQEAFPHLNWCKKQRPNDEFVRSVLRTVIARTSLDGEAL